MNEELLKMFLAGEVLVIFRKKENNLIRNMLCTLNKDLIPPEKYSTLSAIITNIDFPRAVVWDVEALDWRSFYIDSVITIKQTEIKDSSIFEQR
tara:strand:- start:332 stop:613 length:282 start_codon:yes stop_codon:yes gene_type:complete